MFLITPKPKAPARIPNAAEATRNQPLAKIMKPTRVQNACDRCRLKKVKVRSRLNTATVTVTPRSNMHSAMATGLVFAAPKIRHRA